MRRILRRCSALHFVFFFDFDSAFRYCGRFYQILLKKIGLDGHIDQFPGRDSHFWRLPIPV